MKAGLATIARLLRRYAHLARLVDAAAWQWLASEASVTRDDRAVLRDPRWWLLLGAAVAILVTLPLIAVTAGAWKITGDARPVLLVTVCTLAVGLLRGHAWYLSSRQVIEHWAHVFRQARIITPARVVPVALRERRLKLPGDGCALVVTFQCPAGIAPRVSFPADKLELIRSTTTYESADVRDLGGGIGELRLASLPQRVPLADVDRSSLRADGVPLLLGLDTRGETVAHDLSSGHLLVAGMTQMGKSTFLRTLTRQLAGSVARYGGNVLLVDLKGGLGLGALSAESFVSKCVTDREEGLMALEAIAAGLAARAAELRRCGWSNWRDAARGVSVPAVELQVVVIDELAELTLRSGAADPKALGPLERLLRQGLGLGVLLVCGLQRPDAATLGGGRAQFGATVSFRVRNETESEVVFGPNVHDAAFLPPIPGRGVFNDGRASVVFQALKD